MSMFNQVENNELDLLTLLDRPFVAQVAPSLSSLSTWLNIFQKSSTGRLYPIWKRSWQKERKIMANYLHFLFRQDETWLFKMRPFPLGSTRSRTRTRNDPRKSWGQFFVIRSRGIGCCQELTSGPGTWAGSVSGTPEGGRTSGGHTPRGVHAVFRGCHRGRSWWQSAGGCLTHHVHVISHQ